MFDLLGQGHLVLLTERNWTRQFQLPILFIREGNISSFEHCHYQFFLCLLNFKYIIHPNRGRGGVGFDGSLISLISRNPSASDVRHLDHTENIFLRLEYSLLAFYISTYVKQVPCQKLQTIILVFDQYSFNADSLLRFGETIYVCPEWTNRNQVQPHELNNWKNG